MDPNLKMTGIGVGGDERGGKVIVLTMEMHIPVPEEAVDGICAALRGIQLQKFIPGPGHPDFPGEDGAS